MRRGLGKPRPLALPQNLLITPGILYEGFEAVGEWTASSGSIADNAVAGQFKTGTQSIKITTVAGGGGRMWKAGYSWDLTNMWRMSLWIYIHDLPADYNGVWVYLYSGAGTGNYFYHQHSTSNTEAGAQIWNKCKADFIASGAPVWSDIRRIDVLVNAQAGKTVNASVDDLRFGFQGVPAIMFSFADGYASAYSIAYDYMKQLGLRGNLWLQTTYPGGGGHVTWAQVLEMDAAGWTIGNHTNADTNLSGQAEAAQEAQIAAGQSDLSAHGLTRGKNYLNYPAGGNDANTRIAMANTGTVLAQATQPHTSRIGALPPYDIFQTEVDSLIDTTAVATVQGWINDTIARGSILNLGWHDIGGAGQMTAANFRLVMDYIASKKGLITPITIDDYYKLTLGGIRVKGRR